MQSPPRIVWRQPTGGARVKCTAFHATLPWLAISLFTGYVNVYHTETRTLLVSFDCHAEKRGGASDDDDDDVREPLVDDLNDPTKSFAVRGIDFCDFKPLLATGDDTGQVCVFDVLHQSCVCRIRNVHLDFIRTVQFHPSKLWVLTSSDDKSSKVIDLESQRISKLTSLLHWHYIMCAQFCPVDGENLIATGSLDGTVSLLQPNTNSSYFEDRNKHQVRQFLAHEKFVTWVSFHPSRLWLATASDDYSVSLWDITNKSAPSKLATWKHEDQVPCVRFVPSSTTTSLVSCDEAGKVLVWSDQGLQYSVEPVMGRCWHLSCQRSVVVVGCDEGFALIESDEEDGGGSDIERGANHVLQPFDGVCVDQVAVMQNPTTNRYFTRYNCICMLVGTINSLWLRSLWPFAMMAAALFLTPILVEFCCINVVKLILWWRNQNPAFIVNDPRDILQNSGNSIVAADDGYSADEENRSKAE